MTLQCGSPGSEWQSNIDLRSQFSGDDVRTEGSEGSTGISQIKQMGSIFQECENHQGTREMVDSGL